MVVHLFSTTNGGGLSDFYRCFTFDGVEKPIDVLYFIYFDILSDAKQSHFESWKLCRDMRGCVLLLYI